MSRDDGAATPAVHLRLALAPGIAFGPGKADLLERIRDTGSIAAAGRVLHMSYRRAWALVEELNASFGEALVDASKGGSGGGGARLTRRGEDVLRRYRAMQAATLAAIAGDLAALRRRVTDARTGRRRAAAGGQRRRPAGRA